MKNKDHSSLNASVQMIKSKCVTAPSGPQVAVGAEQGACAFLMLKGYDDVYFVDREKVESTLVYIEKQLAIFEETETWESQIEKLALERICHTIIEGILDVGNALIDGFIMRDPGSYEDIIDILNDEKVISDEMSVGLKVIILYRKSLVQDYLNIDHIDVKNAFSKNSMVLKEFTPRVRQYLVDELGPVTAFRN